MRFGCVSLEKNKKLNNSIFENYLYLTFVKQLQQWFFYWNTCITSAVKRLTRLCQKHDLEIQNFGESNFQQVFINIANYHWYQQKKKKKTKKKTEKNRQKVCAKKYANVSCFIMVFTRFTPFIGYRRLSGFFQNWKVFDVTINKHILKFFM